MSTPRPLFGQTSPRRTGAIASGASWPPSQPPATIWSGPGTTANMILQAVSTCKRACSIQAGCRGWLQHAPCILGHCSSNYVCTLQVHCSAASGCSPPSLTFLAPAAVRIQFSNDGNNSWKFLGILAAFTRDTTSTQSFKNIKSHSDRLSFMHYPAGATCWAAGGLQDSTSTSLRNKINPVPPICKTSSDPYLPNYPSGERVRVRPGPGGCPNQGMHSPVRMPRRSPRTAR